MKCNYCKDGKVKIRTKGVKPLYEPCAVCQPELLKAFWVRIKKEKKP